MKETRFPPGPALAVVLGLFLAPFAQADTDPAGARRGTLAEDTRWATPYHVIDSGQAGPTVLVIGGVHGNEPAGARAARQMLCWPIVKGRLIVVPRANQPGLEAGTRYLPGAPAQRRDLNRNFPRGEAPESDGSEASAERELECALAQALWSLALEERPDWVLDLHEGFDFHVANPRSVGASVIHFQGEELDALVDAMLAEVNATIDDPLRRLVALRRGGPVSGSFARAAALRLGAQAMILETCYKDQRLPLRARQHRILVQHLLRHLGMVEDDAATVQRLAPAHSEALRVAVYDDGGVGGAGRQRVEAILEARGAIVRRIDAVDIAQGVLAQFDAAVFSGGSGSAQARSLGEDGRRRVQAFVEGGGGYVGICAGAYLATARYSWSLGLLDARTLHQGNQWRRGRGTVELELTDEGRRILGDLHGRFEVLYANGPIVGPAELAALAEYVPLAHYRTELAENDTPVGLMVHTPAILAGTFGRGRALGIGPHPEQTPGLEELVWRAVRWSAKVEDMVEMEDAEAGTDR